MKKNILMVLIGFMFTACSLLPYQPDFTEGVNQVGGEASNAIANRKFAQETINEQTLVRDFSQYK